MSSLGIDFGTSNCFAHVASIDAVMPIRLDGAAFGLASVAYAARREVAPKPIQEAEVARRLKEMRGQWRRQGQDPRGGLDEASAERMIRDTLRREAIDAASQAYQEQTLFSALESGQGVAFGAAALQLHFADPLGGFLVKSPKAFLGSDMDARRLAAFEDIITAMLRHIRLCAEAQSGSQIERAVLGRPVRYQGIGGEQANAQAVGVMDRAARRAGFQEVRFELEPLAAAYEYERAIERDQLVLVVDVGGGTTDCVVVRLGPGRAGKRRGDMDILGVSGDRVGGNDFDEALAWRAFMPAFGKDGLLKSGLSLPHSVLHDAISIRDIPAQTRFVRAGEQLQTIGRQAADTQLLPRLLALHDRQLQHQLVHCAERSKIDLSDDSALRADLGFVEEGLAVGVDRPLFAAAVNLHLNRIQALAGEAMRQAGAQPDVVFMTGGMAISPIVAAAIGGVAGPGVPIWSSEMLGTVGKGLGLCAQRIFEQPGAD